MFAVETYGNIEDEPERSKASWDQSYIGDRIPMK